MRVSLAPQHLRHAPRGDETLPLPLLSPAGAEMILGGHAGADGLAAPIAPRADTLFGPRGACLAAPEGPLFVSDTGHHRLLVWRQAPTGDGAPADFLIGQPDFEHEGRNAQGSPGPSTLNVPTGVSAAGGVLAVADAWNHRVLLWHGYPDASNRPADVVLGQADFSGGLANRGADAPRADTLNWCYGVAVANGRLIVADTGNRRLLVWDTIPTRIGAPADLVLGQCNFLHRDENAGGDAGARGMRWPHGIATVNGRLMVSDAGNNRVMVWEELPAENGADCDFVLGQAGPAETDHNRGAYYPTADALSMPYGLSVQRDRVVVADTANSRLLGFDLDDLSMGIAATRLSGQRDFSDKGDNRWGFPVRDSLCWPYGIAACDDRLVIADSGNNRVMIWKAAP